MKPMIRRAVIILCAGTALAVTTTAANADIVYADDVIITGGDVALCVGSGCANGESFGGEKIKLKDGLIGIEFDDTGAPGGDNDWQIVINDSSAGFARFAIEDVTAGTFPFKIAGSAPDNSLIIDQSGDIGLGTNSPDDELHIFGTQNPSPIISPNPGASIVFESNNTFLATTRKWMLRGRTENFSLTDVTADLTPFIVQDSAPNSSLVLQGDGRLRMGGGLSSDAPLEVFTDGSNIGTGNAVLKLTNTAGPTALQLDPNDDGTFWNFAALASNNEFRINRSGTGTVSLALTAAGNLTITGSITTGGPTCGTGCDRVFDEDYDLPSIAEHAREMWANKHLPEVGPTPEGKPIDVTDKLGRVINELEKAHIYIEQLHRRLADQEAEKVRLNARLARIEKLLNR